MYGKEHPEWFAMRATGNETPKNTPSGRLDTSVRLQSPIASSDCRGWDGGDVLTLGEADAAGESMCQCRRACFGRSAANQISRRIRLRNTRRGQWAIATARYWKAVYDLR